MDKNWICGKDNSKIGVVRLKNIIQDLRSNTNYSFFNIYVMTSFLQIVPYTYALVNSTKSFKDEKTRVLNEVIQTSHKKEIVYQYLKERHY